MLGKEKILIDFVEGNISIEEFENSLINNPFLEKFLKDDTDLKKDTYIGDNVFDFIIMESWKSPGGQLSIHGAICQHLKRKNIVYNETSLYKDKFNLILDCQPNWLDIDDIFLNNEIILKAPKQSKGEMKIWIENKIKEMFRYATKPPCWIQSPEWPILNGRPLVFLCQQDINNYFHDKATVYIFFDELSEKIETVLQVF
jgi:hypothetical protein